MARIIIFLIIGLCLTTSPAPAAYAAKLSSYATVAFVEVASTHMDSIKKDSYKNCDIKSLYQEEIKKSAEKRKESDEAICETIVVLQ